MQPIDTTTGWLASTDDATRQRVIDYTGGDTALDLVRATWTSPAGVALAEGDRLPVRPEQLHEIGQLDSKALKKKVEEALTAAEVTPTTILIHPPGSCHLGQGRH